LSSPGGAGKAASGSPPEASGGRRAFPPECRLKARRQFQTVYERGRRVRVPTLTLFGLPNTVGRCRLGITVTKRVGGAVIRNRAKRVLREVFRRNAARLEPPLDLVINAHTGMTDHSSAEIERDFLAAFGRLVRAGRRR